MRKMIVLSMFTLDGIIQAPGGPSEDPSGGFGYGGWVAPYDDEVSGKVMEKLLKPADLLLGRTTFEIWEDYWPKHENVWPGINEVTKYVLSGTREKSEWKNVVFFKNLMDIRELRNSEGPDVQVWGSSQVVQLLLEYDLVDELWLMFHPLMLGRGKKLFNDRAVPAAFQLVDSTITTTGVIIANYIRAGEVKTGTIGA